MRAVTVAVFVAVSEVSVFHAMKLTAEARSVPVIVGVVALAAMSLYHVSHLAAAAKPEGPRRSSKRNRRVLRRLLDIVRDWLDDRDQ